MTAVSPPAAYQVTIGGNVSGQLAVGENIIQIGRVEGGIVYLAQPGQTAAPRLRPTPIFQRPRRFGGLLDRVQERGAAAAALQSGLPVEFYGEPGIGKTVLLRYLAFHLPADPFPDGVIYLRVQDLALDDILQNLYDAFYYESDIPFKPTLAQLRHALQDKEALVLLDDVAVDRDDLDALLDVAPSCTFLLAAGERRLWGEGRAIALAGLPPDDSLKLLERELGRSLAAGERTSAQRWHGRLQGHPFRLRQVASLARDRELSLTELEAYLAADEPQLATQHVAALPERERRVVLALAAASGRSLSSPSLASLANISDLDAVLATLAERGLVQLHGRQATLSGAVAAALEQAVDLAPYREQALATFTQLAQTEPAVLAADSSAVQHLLHWALATGRGPEALRLVRAADNAIALGRQWTVWKDLLQTALHAARAVGDRSAEAWAWHQLGTRALCLEENEAARAALLRALRLRRELGEHAAAAITRHNLKILMGPPPNGDPPNGRRPANGGPPGAGGLFSLLAMVAITAVVAVILVTLPALNRPQPSNDDTAPLVLPTSTPTTVPTTIPTNTPTTAPTNTPTTVPTNTPTTIPTITPTPCRPAPPSGWVSYLVQSGDTLFSLAQATGTTAEMIRRVNCLDGTLFAGAAIWLPPLPTATLTPTPGLPDLVITAMQVTGPMIIAPYPGQDTAGIAAPQPLIQVPLRVVVANQGGLEADIFKVTTAVNGFGQAAGTIFVRPGEREWPFTTAPLAAGSQVAIDGLALFLIDLQGQTITLLAKADSCDGERVLNAGACRVAESNEDNNVSSLNLALPVYRPEPTATATATPLALFDEPPTNIISTPADDLESTAK